MSTTSVSGLTLPKATLTVVDGAGVTPFLKFRYNPTEYSVSKSARWNRPPTRAAESSTPPEFTGSDPMSISMEIFLDAFEEPAGDVSPDVMVLLSWTKPTPVSLARGLAQPPLLRFIWGANPVLQSFQGYLKSVQARGAREGRRAHVVSEGETLQSIAHQEYGQAALWRGLASFNDIDDPMRVAPGAELLIPTATEAKRLAGVAS